MIKNTLPVVGIIVVTIILLTINQFTESTIIKDYALIFIISGMILGVSLTKIAEKSKNNK